MKRRVFTLGAAIVARQVSAATVQLTLATDENQRFAQGLRATMKPVAEALSGRLLQPLADARIDPTNPHRALVHAMVVVNRKVRAVYSDYPPSLNLPASQGSISKALGLLALHSHPELLEPGSLWRARPLGGLREADGTKGGGSITALEAVARSRNLPSAWAFRQVADADLRRYLLRAGLALPSGYHAGVALAFGHLRWSPLDVVQTFHALGGGGAMHLSPAPLRRVIADWVLTCPQLPRVNQLLAAPITHTRGTLRHLSAALKGGFHHAIGKTGTAINAHGQDIAKVAVFTYRPRPEVLVTNYLAVCAPSASHPLGDSLPTSAFAPMHKFLVAFSKEFSS